MLNRYMWACMVRGAHISGYMLHSGWLFYRLTLIALCEAKHQFLSLKIPNLTNIESWHMVSLELSRHQPSANVTCITSHYMLFCNTGI